MDTDVLILGAGPVGLTLANLLGGYGVRATVIEQGEKLIDYPRGVGLDDEALRTFQTAGVVERVLPHTTPQHIMRMTGGAGQVLAEIAPPAIDYGWSRRNAFIQPLVDRELLAGLERFAHVDLRFGHRSIGYTDDGDGVTVTIEDAEGRRSTIRARYLVGCDGGRSATRRSMGITFEGITSPTRWLVVDVRNDPLGTPNAYLGADPRRPFVSIGLPHGIRRFEFMVFDHETDEQVAEPAFVHAALVGHVPDPASLDYIRQRVYTHNARIAGNFRKGNVLIAGDAAHLMPVWQGQGYNSGVRDATNLAWKLAAVVTGVAGDRLLDTYDTERRDHAKAMIDLSVAVGRILSPTNTAVGRIRDLVAKALNLVPPAKRYIAEMRFKPQPRFHAGALVPAVGPVADADPVGRMFPAAARHHPGRRGAPARRRARAVVLRVGVGQRPAGRVRRRRPRHPALPRRAAGGRAAHAAAALGAAARRRSHRRRARRVRRSRRRRRRRHRQAQDLVRRAPRRVRRHPARPLRRGGRAGPARAVRRRRPGGGAAPERRRSAHARLCCGTRHPRPRQRNWSHRCHSPSAACHTARCWSSRTRRLSSPRTSRARSPPPANSSPSSTRSWWSCSRPTTTTASSTS